MERTGPIIGDECYHGGAFFEAIGEDFDQLGRRREIVNADVLDAWYPPAPSVIFALAANLPWLLRTSPPTHCRGLIRAIAAARGIPPACVLPGAGSSDLIFRALPAWLTSSSRVLLLDPTYGEYAHICERVIGCPVDRLPLNRSDHYRLCLERLTDRLQGGYDLVILVNPNNPTGQHVPRNDLEASLRRLPAKTKCWVDEAYIDYAGAGESLEQFAAASPNVIVCKSLSKTYALSGARVAYLVAAERLVSELRSLTPPWSVCLPAQVAAVHALAAPAYYTRRYSQTVVLRQMLARGVQKAIPGAEILTGVGNFVLCHLPPTAPSAAEVVRHCRTRGVFIRDVGEMGQSLGSHTLRIAVKRRSEQRRVLEALTAALAAEPAATFISGT